MEKTYNKYKKEFEKLGKTSVRNLLENNLLRPYSKKMAAGRWLDELREEREKKARRNKLVFALFIIISTSVVAVLFNWLDSFFKHRASSIDFPYQNKPKTYCGLSAA